MKKLKRILIGEKTYPIKIDLNVLEYIQEEYGTIHQFEMDLLGYRYKKDGQGNQIYDKEGEPLLYKTEPSIKAIKTVLPAAVREGLAIEAGGENRRADGISEDEILQNCTIPFEELGKILHEEFRRCFETKK